MTDTEWLACDDPERLLGFLLRRRDRKFRLAAVAACRNFSDFLADDCISDLVTDEHRREACEVLDVAERFADGLATEIELESARSRARAVYDALAAASRVLANGPEFDDEKAMRLSDALDVASAIGNSTSSEPDGTFPSLWTIPGTEFLVVRVLQEVFDPPTPRSFSRDWVTATVTTLAQTAYDERAFGHQPILADALEDAGCTNRDILDHLRHPSGHVRGCWALDLILAKGR